MPKHGVMVAGDALMDMQYFVESLPQKGGDARILERRASTGGAAANTAYTLAKLGVKTAFLGCMGRDAFAEQISEQLVSVGVDTALVQYDGETGYTVDMIDPSGERTMLSFRGASASAIMLTDAVRTRLTETAVFLISGYMLTDSAQSAFALKAAAVVRQSGGLVALDPCPVVGEVPDSVLTSMLSLTDILLPNAEEYEILEKRAHEIVAKVPCIALKLGGKGARLMIKKGFALPSGDTMDGDIILDASAEPKKAVDTTGAGDAFNAGLVAGMLAGGRPEDWLKLAEETAGKCIEKPGAVI